MPALSPEQVARYRAEGWLLLERALPVPALAALQAAAESLVALAATRSASDAVLDLGPDHRPGRPRVRRIKNAHLQHPAFAAICRDPRLRPDGGRRNVTSEMLHCPFPAAILSLLRGEVPANVVNPAVPEHPAFRRRLERYRAAARQNKILFDPAAIPS